MLKEGKDHTSRLGKGHSIGETNTLFTQQDLESTLRQPQRRLVLPPSVKPDVCVHFFHSGVCPRATDILSAHLSLHIPLYSLLNWIEKSPQNVSHIKTDQIAGTSSPWCEKFCW